MHGKVGVRSVPKGGFGNRVLSYLSIRHLAEEVGASYFFVDPHDRQLITDIHRPHRMLTRLSQQTVFRAVDTQRDTFLGEVVDAISHGRFVVFKGPLLGQVLVRFAKTDSRKLTQLRAQQCARHRKILGSRMLITAHLRAGDFREWEPAAVLPLSYYTSALDALGPLPTDEWRVRICVDDESHPALEGLREDVRARGLLLNLADCVRPFDCDLASMAQSDYLISSPSTFALVAGMLGKPRVIHSAQWVENRVARGEDFWRHIGEGTFPGYALERLV